MTKFFETPFAQAGNKTAVPDALQPDGSISYTEGWSPDYERPNTDPDYKPIGREQTNQMFFDITEAMGLVQREGILFWDATFAYSQYARVVGSDGVLYRAVIANTGNNPVGDDGTYWIEQAKESWTGLIESPGWKRTPLGDIVQWGSSVNNASTSGTIILPISFNSSIFSILITDSSQGFQDVRFSAYATPGVLSSFSWSSNIIPGGFYWEVRGI